MEDHLFGREDALRIVGDLMERGGSAVAVGDPGVGKSSLVKAAAELARHRGRRVISVAPTRFEQGLPFAGLAELFGQFPQGVDQDLPGPQRNALAVALHRAEPTGREADALAVPLAVRNLLTLLCEAEPVALLIDDLQWLDQASLDSLGFALRGALPDPGRLSVVVASRPDPESGSELLRCLPEPRLEFVVRPLAGEAVGRLLRARLGPHWTPPKSAEVARTSGGNPFLALEIARAADQGVLAPPVLSDLLEKRVSRLTDDAREVLLLASAAGRLTVTQARAIVAQDRLVPALEAAADADVVEIGAGSVISFTHPLLASAIYDGATPAERRRAHRVLAATLEDPVERARHRGRSITVPDEAVAVELDQAAELSQARGAPHLAGELLEGAALATLSEQDAGVSRWLRAVDAYSGAGDAVAARAALCKASGLATDPEQQAQVLVRRIRLAKEVPTAQSAAEKVLELAPAGSATRAEVLCALASILRMQGDGPRALELAREAVTEAVAAKRPDLQLIALIERISVERLWGVGAEQLSESARAIEQLADLPGLPPSFLAFTRSFNARWDDPMAERQVRDGIEEAVETGRYGDLPRLYSSLILVLIRKSKVHQARVAHEEAERSGAWAPAIRDWAFHSQKAVIDIAVASYAGDLDVARELVRDSASEPRIRESPYKWGARLAQLGFVEASARNWRPALEALRELAEIFESTGMVDLEGLLWGVDYADAALQVGAIEDVEAAISILRRQGAAGRLEATVAADRCQALLTAARGDGEAAVRHLREIVDRAESETPFEAARSRLALGQVYRRAGYKGMAHEALTTAASTFDGIGTPRWAERARDEAGRVGLHSTTGALTQTERRIAELVAAGRTNQETAAELFISAKTVETNLTRIYRKLSVRSRTELANLLNTKT